MASRERERAVRRNPLRRERVRREGATPETPSQLCGRSRGILRHFSDTSVPESVSQHFLAPPPDAAPNTSLGVARSARFPLKKAAPPPVGYLEKHEIEALLDAPDTSTPRGRLERALLMFRIICGYPHMMREQRTSGSTSGERKRDHGGD